MNKSKVVVFSVLLVVLPFISCKQKDNLSDMNILYLHHSTGGLIWQGKQQSLFIRGVKKISPELATRMGQQARVPELMAEYNKKNNKNYSITETFFPKETPYGWRNYPYDYYNIWVKNAGSAPFMEEPTLEMLTKQYQVITFKHCYPVSNIQPNRDSADINSDYRSLANYKLQYNALRDKLYQFPGTKFILFTGAAQVKNNISEEEAERAREFFKWVVYEWDQPDDNIHIWDLYSLETAEGLYLKEEYATSPDDSHPNNDFSYKASQLIFNRIIDVIENDGQGTSLTGEKL